MQLAVDAREAGARIPFAERARGWRTSREPARGRGRGRGWRGGLPDGGRLSHLHPSSVAMETVRAPSPLPAATAAAA